MRRLFLLALLVSASKLSTGQIDSTQYNWIEVKGKIREESNQPISNVIVINQRSKTGAFGHSDGSYYIKCLKTDTLTITSLGYYPRNLCFKDSTDKTVYQPTTYLSERTETLAIVEIFAPRDLEKIQADIMKLGYEEKDFVLSGINAFASPITFLYEEFSKKEQSKREVARLENEDNKRDLLKELFHYYVDYDIIQLSNEEFDDFINFMNVSDEFMKNSSQYDFLIFVRDRFNDYKIARRNTLRFKDSDYDFDQD